MKLILVLATAAAIFSASGDSTVCSTLSPNICDPHTTTVVTWSCNDGPAGCCKVKDIGYKCYAGDTEHDAVYRWALPNSVCPPAWLPGQSEPVCAVYTQGGG